MALLSLIRIFGFAEYTFARQKLSKLVFAPAYSYLCGKKKQQTLKYKELC